MITPEQRDYLKEEFRKRFESKSHTIVGYGQVSSWLNSILTAHTEPENLTLDVDKGDKTPRNGADCQAHTEPEDCEHGYRINPVEGVHIPCPDCHTEPEDECTCNMIDMIEPHTVVCLICGETRTWSRHKEDDIQIALRKIEEYLAYCRITEERGMWVERPTFDSMKDWLQQEDK